MMSPVRPRRFRALFLALSAFLTLAVAAPPASAACVKTKADSVAEAYSFLAKKIDQYGTGTTLRLPQSYTGGYFASITFVSSFLYDDSLAVVALLKEGTAAQKQRARVLGDAILYAQDHDPVGDGRTRASYQPDPFVTADGSPYIGSPAAYTGNQAWAGIALAHLYKATGDARYLAGAVKLANWIQAKTADTRGVAGYTGGRDGNDVAMTFKASEHNIDVGAFFAMVATLTGDRVWSTRSTTAYTFVRAMQDSAGGMVWTGTDPDGVTINRKPIPADVQTWAYLATRDTRYSKAIDWALTHLSTTDRGFTGISYSDADVSKVWFEGTAHLVAALNFRQATGDAARISALLGTLRSAQASAPNADGQGLVSASSDGLDTGFGDLYYASLHTGATAWYLIAAKKINPFVL